MHALNAKAVSSPLCTRISRLSLVSLPVECVSPRWMEGVSLVAIDLSRLWCTAGHTLRAAVLMEADQRLGKGMVLKVRIHDQIMVRGPFSPQGGK